MIAYRTIQVDGTEAFYREGGQLLDTGHLATATHSEEIVESVAAFLDEHIARVRSRPRRLPPRPRAPRPAHPSSLTGHPTSQSARATASHDRRARPARMSSG
jgi:hypothetical protein